MDLGAGEKLRGRGGVLILSLTAPAMWSGATRSREQGTGEGSPGWAGLAV